ncbi:MAG: hypothetical protein JST20_04040 [Bacteroidetes bacterium]|nr:hypothetical protein [Bacteroidota bacterium]
MLKKALLTVCVLACSSHFNAMSQTLAEMKIGPFVAGKAGINTSKIQTGTKTGMTINMPPDFGITLYQPFDAKKTSAAITFDVGYNTQAVLSKPESGATDDNTLITSIHYLNFAPNFHIGGFVIGINYGIPLSANSSNKSNSVSVDAPNTDNLSSLFEFRMGALVPIAKDATGQLNFTIMGAYNLSTIYSNYSPLPSESNPSAASLAIGLSYIFNLSHSE